PSTISALRPNAPRSSSAPAVRPSALPKRFAGASKNYSPKLTPTKSSPPAKSTITRHGCDRSRLRWKCFEKSRVKAEAPNSKHQAPNPVSARLLWLLELLWCLELGAWSFSRVTSYSAFVVITSLSPWSEMLLTRLQNSLSRVFFRTSFRNSSFMASLKDELKEERSALGNWLPFASAEMISS